MLDLILALLCKEYGLIFVISCRDVNIEFYMVNLDLFFNYYT